MLVKNFPSVTLNYIIFRHFNFMRRKKRILLWSFAPNKDQLYWESLVFLTHSKSKLICYKQIVRKTEKTVPK